MHEFELKRCFEGASSVHFPLLKEKKIYSLKKFTLKYFAPFKLYSASKHSFYDLSIKYWIYVSKVDGICKICNYTETFYENVNVVHWYNKPKNASVTILNMHSVNGSAIFARYWKFAPRMRKNFGNSHWSKSIIQNKKGKFKSFCMQNVYL